MEFQHLDDWNCLALVGPTASGKSHLAMELAKTLPIEIISMDSALVYKGMDIGTAKPSVQDLSQVPHHLINIIEPWQSYSAAQFAKDAQHLIAEISARQRIPVLVGGTFLYYKALRNGLDELPSTNAEIRNSILAQARDIGWPAMHDLLREIDPVIAARLAPNDAQRIGRAIEVWRMTGQQLSSFQIQGKNQEKSNASKLRLCVVSLEPADRGWLHKQVEIRYSKMIQDGFLFEALNLFENQQLDAELSSMRCVGYRQAWALLENPLVFKELKAQALNRELTQSFLKSKEFEYFLSTSLAATRQLAKRQLTWLRSMPERHVIQCDDASGVKAWRDEVFPSHLLPMYRAYEP